MPRESERTGLRARFVNTRVAEVAGRQRGVVDLADLRACGLSEDEVRARVRAGTLFRVYRGVYAVGHPRLSVEGRFLAAVKACGAGAALSHYCAAVLWGLRPWIHRFPDVTSRRQVNFPGINNHRSDRIEATVHKGIPVVTPRWAIFGIAPVVPIDSLRSAVNHALGLELVAFPELITYTGRGAKQLRAVLATAAPTKSENENLVLHLMHVAQLPRPLVNRVIRTTWTEATKKPGAVQRKVREALYASSTSRT